MKHLALAFVIALAMQASVSNAQYDPHPKNVTYTEDFRGQFHFSPKSEWMNDVNALMYHDGKYHMIYQWGKRIRHGGYATSKDLLHWTDEGVALIPQKTFLPKETKNVSGHQVYSGSGVVVSGETAEKITGSKKEAMVAIYTGTASGTCLAWSNDGGKKWHDYKANPVANPTRGANPRDPHVFLYEPTKTWILAIFERGTTFYGSKDLIKWEKLSNIRFGFECPDIYEIPLDGDKSKVKWVLQDANGSYLVGQFDGKTFTKEQDKLVMDVGPDFYAAQTFFRPNLPTKALLQLAWHDHWNGGVGEKGWERHATFPVEVGLVTYEGKMRITRTPIATIKNLYKGTKTWKNETLKEGKNFLENTKSKTFDMTAVFDLKETKATEINFQIANIKLKYDIKNKMFHGMRSHRNKPVPDKPKALKPDANGVLTVRMLVDWSQLEVFSAGGVFSYSANLPFTPKDSSLGLTSAGGDVKLVSMTMNEVGRIWPEVKDKK
ncbi:MAG: glycoside hydrolase family 32 protein [Phycisphaerae bacterium]|jgi:levanase/fructan beta-fructosidase|nr:glycoside hydrolase family 32 protein [Phycisphaerae bacterium]